MSAATDFLAVIIVGGVARESNFVLRCMGTIARCCATQDNNLSIFNLNRSVFKQI